MPLICESASATHTGNVRPLNEDAFCDNRRHRIWCVADGMGGYEAGEVASAMLVEAVRHLPAPLSLEQGIEQLRDVILGVNYRLSAEMTMTREDQVMGCTVVALTIVDDECACLWAGDSRLYLYRGNSLYQMSRDHSVVEELIEQGVIQPEEALQHPQRHVITRAVGVDEALELEQISFTLEANDVLLLCSDGLYGELHPDAIMTILAQEDTCNQKAETLIQRTLAGEARDNVTVSVIAVQDA
mgnify:CR=1 FL=1